MENRLNQYTSRGVPGTVDIIGAANAVATATVNGQSTYRRVEYYQKALAIVNTSTNVWQSVTNQVVLTGTTNVTTGNIYLPKTQETFAFDADGNLTNDGRWIFIWDAENRPLQMLSSNAVDGAKKKLDFVYDWRGRRRSKIVSTWSGSAFNPASTNRFVYDDWNLVAEMDATNNLIRSYLWGLDLSGTMQGAGGVGGLVAVNIVTNGVHFCAYDGNGNVAGLVKGTDGTISAQYAYGPFGELVRSSGTAATANPCRFSTKFTDDESDFLYYGYRYYNSSAGRWLGRDPLGEGGFGATKTDKAKPKVRYALNLVKAPPVGVGNLYLFVFNSQVNRVDLLGLNAYVANAGGYTGHTSFVVDNPAGGIIAYHFFAAHQSAAAPWYTEALPLAYGSVRIWPQPASSLDEYLAKEGANYGDISIWAVGLGTQNDDAMAIQRMNQEIEDQDGYYSLLGGRECHRQSWYWFHDYTCAGRDVPTSQILGLTQPVINEKPIALPDRFTLTHDLSLPQFSWFGP